eukprot:5180915-Pyramimonas_sp.AAC.2
MTSDAEYIKEIQAKEQKEIELVAQGYGSELPKDPTLAAFIAYGAVASVTVAGALYYFENSPTNKMWKAEQSTNVSCVPMHTWKHASRANITHTAISFLSGSEKNKAAKDAESADN